MIRSIFSPVPFIFLICLLLISLSSYNLNADTVDKKRLAIADNGTNLYPITNDNILALNSLLDGGNGDLMPLQRPLQKPLCGDSMKPVTERVITWVRKKAKPEDARDLPLEIDIAGCNVRGCDGEVLENCFRGRHIIFIGDSVTRYQYLNLAQRLTYGTWTAFHGSSPLSESEKTWNSWPHFMEQTNLRFKGLEICDCFRNPGHPWISENRYYFNPVLGVRLTYIYMTEVGGSRYHSLDFINATCGNPCGCRGCIPGPNCRLSLEDFALNHYPMGELNAQARFLQSIVVGSVESAIQLAPVDALVLNIGYFGGAGWPQETHSFKFGLVSREVYKLAMVNVTKSLRALNPPPHALIWKVTTASADNDYKPVVEVEWVNSTLVPLGWQLFDAYSITRSFEGKIESFITNDGVHFQPHVYQGLNKALALHLCGHTNSTFRFFMPVPSTCKIVNSSQIRNGTQN